MRIAAYLGPAGTEEAAVAGAVGSTALEIKLAATSVEKRRKIPIMPPRKYECASPAAYMQDSRLNLNRLAGHIRLVSPLFPVALTEKRSCLTLSKEVTMPIGTLTSKGQITLPALLREKLRLAAGDRVSFEEQADGSYLLRPMKADVRRLKGAVPRTARPVTPEDLDQAIRGGFTR
jgi:antitoxin PrlF